MDATSQELGLIFGLIREKTGIQMNESKKALLINRLSRRLAALKLDSYEEYYRYLKKGDEAEMSRFIDAVTTNETFFFRAPKMWDFFSSKFIPEYFRESQGKPLKIWSAAASSGEEPYTIAILCEEFAKTHSKFQWSLQSSDISEEMLRKCREGEYDSRSVEIVPKPLLKSWFDAPEPGRYLVKEDLKKKVKFFRHKLQDPVPGKEFDVIFVRNVLIYFDIPTKEAIVRSFHAALKSGGLIIVGESESLVNIKTDFKYVAPSIYQKERDV